MPRPDPSDEDGVLIKKLKHACDTYASSSKKYLAAVKELDSAMESIAIAIRELAQGEEDAALRAKADLVCSSVDRHMAGHGASSSKSRRDTAAQNTAPASDADYTFAAYMSDFTREISSAVEELKAAVKSAEKAKSTHDEMTSKYNKKRAGVSEMETKLAMKNKGIADNPKFSKKVEERDKAKITLDAETERYNRVYRSLLEKRSQTLQRVVEGLNKYSVKYYDSLAKAISSGY